jgi:hypothetical protein
MPEMDKDLEKYIRVKALADAGMPGERDNALRALHRMEEKIPGLRKQYEDWLVTQKTTAEPPSWQPESGGAPPPAYDHADVHGGGRGVFDWETFGRWAQNAASSAFHFAESVGQALYGRQLAAQHVSLKTKVSSTNHVLLTYRMAFDVYETACGLNELQQNAFRKALHEQLDQELDRILIPDD